MRFVAIQTQLIFFLYVLSLLSSFADPACANRAYTRALTRSRVHVRHINYNDFLPLMPERDLNYRYPPGRGGEREKERGRESERDSEGIVAGAHSRDYRVRVNISGIKFAS